jgi:type I restriction enzyme R subunit
LRDYITGYQSKSKDDQIQRLADVFGLSASKLREMVNLKWTEANINEYGRFDRLKEAVDLTKARAFFEKRQGGSMSPPKVNIKVDGLLRKFLLEGGFDVG